MPRVSVIIPSHNRLDLLSEAVASISKQSFSDWEVVIVDDGSEPPVPLDAYATQYGGQVRGLRHDTPLGGPAAKNAGVEAGTGEIVCFLDDDDLYDPGYIEQAIGVLDQHPELDLAFMGVHWFGPGAEWHRNAYDNAMRKTLREAGGSHLEGGLIMLGKDLLGALLNSVPMAFQRPVVRRAAFDRIGGYREGCLLWDCEWALRAAMYSQPALLATPLYQQRCAKQGYSSRADRKLDHIRSDIEIKDQLLRDHSRTRGTSRLLRQAAATSWFNAAYYHYGERNQGESAIAWWESLIRHFHPGRARFILKILMAMVRPPRRAQGASKPA